MGLTISPGYHIWDDVIRSGYEAQAGIRNIFVGSNKVGYSTSAGDYSSSAIAGYIQDASGISKEITGIYIGNKCIWSRGHTGTIEEYVKVSYRFYQNGIGVNSTAESVESYKSMQFDPSSEPTAIGVYIEPIQGTQIEVNIYKNGEELVPAHMGGANDSYTFDNGNILTGPTPQTLESIFGMYDPYVYKFKSDYTQGTSSGASANTSSGSQSEYTFEIVRLISQGLLGNYKRVVLATMTVDLAGHDYHGYL